MIKIRIWDMLLPMAKFSSSMSFSEPGVCQTPQKTTHEVKSSQVCRLYPPRIIEGAAGIRATASNTTS